jgi:hypothetical protein
LKPVAGVNEAGFFENQQVLDLHEDLLRQLVAIGVIRCRYRNRGWTTLIWRPALERQSITRTVIISLHHPTTVAASLARRDGLEPGLSEFLWVLHYLEAERHSRGLSRRILAYDHLLQNPEQSLPELANWLQFDFDRNNALAALEYVNQSLRHHNAGDLSDNPELRTAVSLLAHDDIDDPTVQRQLDSPRTHARLLEGT